MGIEDKLRAKQQEVESQREQKRQQEEQEKFASLRQQIDELRQKKEHLESLLQNLMRATKEATAALTSFKETKAPLDELYTKYEDILKEAGTETKADFLQSEEYADEPEVQGYKAAGQGLREKVGGLSQTKAGLREEIPNLDFRGGVTSFKLAKRGVKAESQRQHAFELIKQKIAEMQIEIDKLHEQTPEGKAEKLEKGKQSIEKRLEKREGYKFGTHLPELVDKQDYADGQEYGEEMVKNLILEHSLKRAEQALESDRKAQGLDVLAKDIEIIKNLPEEMEKARQAINAAHAARDNAINGLERFLKRSPQDSYERIRRYFGYNIPPENAAKELIKIYESGLFDYSSPELKELPSLGRDSTEGEVILQRKMGSIYNSQKSVYTRWVDGRSSYETDLPNTPYIIDSADRIKQGYQNLLKLLGQGIDALPLEYDEMNEIRKQKILPPSQLEKEDQTANLWIDEETRRALREKGFDSTVKWAQKREQELAEQTARIKERVPAKINLDWLQQRFGAFEREHGEQAAINLTKLENQKQQSAEAQILITRARTQLTDVADQRAGIYKGGYDYENPYSLSFPDLRRQVTKLGDEIDTLEREIPQLQRQRENKSREDKGLFNRRAKQIGEDLKVFDSQIQHKVSLLNQKKGEQAHLIGVQDKIADYINPILKVLKSHENLSSENITVGEFMTKLEKSVERVKQSSLPPDEIELALQYRDLERQVREAEQVYKNTKE